MESLALTGYPDARLGRTLAANFTLKTFIYLGDQAAAPGPGGAKGGAKGGAPKAAAPVGPVPAGANRGGGI